MAHWSAIKAALKMNNELGASAIVADNTLLAVSAFSLNNTIVD